MCITVSCGIQPAQYRRWSGWWVKRLGWFEVGESTGLSDGWGEERSQGRRRDFWLGWQGRALPLDFYCLSLLTFGRGPSRAGTLPASVPSAECLHPLHLVQAPTGILKCPHPRAPNKSLTDFKILRTRSSLWHNHRFSTALSWDSWHNLGSDRRAQQGPPFLSPISHPPLVGGSSVQR